MSGLSALVKTGKAAKNARKAAPFYSAVDEAAAALTRGKGTGKEFMIEVLKKPGVKPTEIKERGLAKIEAMPKMTKEQFLEELEKRPPPQVEEKVLRDPTKREIEDRAHEMAYEDSFDELRAEGMNRHEAEDVAAEMAEDRADDFIDQAREELMEGGDAPYHGAGNTVIPGGQNYREMLLKMPAFKDNKKLMELESMRRRVDPDTNPSRHQELTKQIDDLKAKKAAMPEQFQGVGAHFGGEPGILASIRVSDRKGPKGEKVLHVEEIQSDWHQQGRKKGYKNPQYKELESEIEKLRVDFEKGLLTEDQAKPMMMELRRQQEALGAQSDVPDAPFKKNWHELAMKRVLNYAAENGYDRVAITPGAEQASRYNLAKQVEHITAAQEDGKFRIFARDLQGKNHDMGIFEAEQLPDVVGKDLAGKIAGQTKPTDIYEGVDLEVGGEGMKGFYDKMLPDYLNSYGKKYGVQVTPFDIELKPETRQPTYNFSGQPSGETIYPSESKQVHGFDITPEMRQEITGKGMPLYQQIGIPTGGAAAGMGALEQEDQGFAVGGEVDYDIEEILHGRPEPSFTERAKKYGEGALSFVNRGMDSIFPVRKFGRAALESYVQAPIQDKILASPKDFLEVQDYGQSDAINAGRHIRNAARRKLGLIQEEDNVRRDYGDLGGVTFPQKKAAGGAITGPTGSEYDTTPDMSDGGQAIQGAAFKNGGRVHLSQNPDTMLLDLMSRS